MRRHSLISALLCSALLFLAVPRSARGQTCCSGAPSGPLAQDCNAGWAVPTQVAACPAGDSLWFSPSKPSRFRATVHYEDSFCNPKVGVPPESIYVTVVSTTGNLRLNDKSTKVFADDSTNSGGNTRITLPSFSGCGNITLRLWVSGKIVSQKTSTVRTTDTNADDRTTGADSTSACDLNFNGTSADTTDRRLVRQHLDHWKRNALHGTLVRRTNLSESGANPHIGLSVDFWSPSGRWIAYTVGDTVFARNTCPAGHGCYVMIIASDPKDGNTPRQFTWEDTTTTWAAYPYCTPYRDYDPSWSPTGYEIVFDRDDWTILRKGIPGVAGVTDTSAHLVTQSGDIFSHGDDGPCISPDGQWVAFARFDHAPDPLRVNLWKVPIGGGTPKRLTSTPVGYVDFYPRWSPDGTWIMFDRTFPPSELVNCPQHDKTHAIYKVPSDSGAVVQVYGPVFAGGDTLIAVTPAWSEDGLVITGGRGKRISKKLCPNDTTTTDSSKVVSLNTYTFDPALSPSGMTPIANYVDPPFTGNGYGVDPVPSPVLSPDGTRLLLQTSQIWATRRNMNVPPQFTDVHGPIADTTAAVYVFGTVGITILFTVSASDFEPDALTYSASFLQLGMTFDPGTRTFSWTPPPGTANKTYYVKFQVKTSSGGTDAVICAIPVSPGECCGPENVSAIVTAPGPNPTRERFTITPIPLPGVMAELMVFDLSGRRIAVVQGRSDLPLAWNGRDATRTMVPPGVYLYRVRVGSHSKEGKVVVLR